MISEHVQGLAMAEQADNQGTSRLGRSPVPVRRNMATLAAV